MSLSAPDFSTSTGYRMRSPLSEMQMVCPLFASPIRVIFKTLISRDPRMSRFTAIYAGMPMCNLIGD